MSDYLTRLAARALGYLPTLQPLHEPWARSESPHGPSLETAERSAIPAMSSTTPAPSVPTTPQSERPVSQRETPDAPAADESDRHSAVGAREPAARSASASERVAGDESDRPRRQPELTRPSAAGQAVPSTPFSDDGPPSRQPLLETNRTQVEFEAAPAPLIESRERVPQLERGADLPLRIPDIAAAAALPLNSEPPHPRTGPQRQADVSRESIVVRLQPVGPAIEPADVAPTRSGRPSSDNTPEAAPADSHVPETVAPFGISGFVVPLESAPLASRRDESRGADSLVHESAGPQITVRIGRIEIRSATDAASERSRPQPRAPALSLADYLQRRNGEPR